MSTVEFRAHMIKADEAGMVVVQAGPRRRGAAHLFEGRRAVPKARSPQGPYDVGVAPGPGQAAEVAGEAGRP